MMDGSMMTGWAWIWPVLVLVGLVLLGYVAFQLARARRAPGAGSGGRARSAESSARRILDERYARGEIDDAEYHRRRDELR